MLHSIDSRGLIMEVSDLWLAKLGYTWDEVIGRASTEFLSEESARYAREVVLPAFFATGACLAEYDMRKRDGTLLPVRLHGIAVRASSGTFERSIAVIEDLSERRALERKMFEVQKLESLGLMAGNIAHDFNNLLASVVGGVEIAMRHAAHVPAAGSALDTVLIAAARAADLCRQLLAYSGRGRFVVEQVSLDDLVVEMVQVLQVTVGKLATVRLDLAREGTLVEVDVTQIRQVVMNLVLNAADAIAEGGGTIAIRTSACTLDAEAIANASHRDISPGPYVCLEVSDDGAGMAADVLSHLFDPFFTTKATGRGLGLAAVHGIVRGHRGTLAVTSEVGRGTTFKIYLPRATLLGRVAVPSIDPPELVQRGTILVVDDDDLVRETITRQLEEVGYIVVPAASASAALELVTAVKFTAFLLDVSMPGTSGPELATQIIDLLPEARIILTSGFDQVDLPTELGARFLQKPFTEDDLLRALDQGAVVSAVERKRPATF